VGLTTLPSSCADFLEIWEPQPPGTFKACPGLSIALRFYYWRMNCVKRSNSWWKIPIMKLIFTNFFLLYLSLPSSYVHVFSSAHYFQTPLLCALFSVWKYKFHSLNKSIGSIKYCVLQHLVANSGVWGGRQPAPREFNLLLLSPCLQLSIVSAIPKYLNFATLSEDLLK